MLCIGQRFEFANPMVGSIGFIRHGAASPETLSLRSVHVGKVCQMKADAAC